MMYKSWVCEPTYDASKLDLFFLAPMEGCSLLGECSQSFAVLVAHPMNIFTSLQVFGVGYLANASILLGSGLTPVCEITMPPKFICLVEN